MGESKDGSKGSSTTSAHAPSSWTTSRVLALVAAVAAVAIVAGIVIGRMVAPAESTPSAAKPSTQDAQSAQSTAQGSAGGPAAQGEAPSAGGINDSPSSSGSGNTSGGGGSANSPGRDVPLAPSGSELTSVPSAPEMTISQIKVPKDFTSARCTAVLEPYGWAPDGERGKRMAVKIVSWDAGGSKDLKDLKGRNALIYVAESESAPTAGGRYQSSIEVRSTGEGRAALFLTGVRTQ